MLRAVFNESEQKGLLLSLTDKTPYGEVIDIEQLPLISSRTIYHLGLDICFDENN